MSLKRIVVSIGLVIAGVLLELVGLAVSGAIIKLFSLAIRTPDKATSSFHVPLVMVWYSGVIYRTMFLHIYVSWRLKRLLIKKNLPSVQIALYDLILALAYAGILSLFLGPARALFRMPEFGVPIFFAIFLSTLLFCILFRGQVTALNKT